MSRNLTTSIVIFALSAGLSLGDLDARGAAGPSGADDPAALEAFEREVRPVLVARCVACHGPEKQKAGLRLDSRSAVVTGGETGPAAVPGKPDESLLIEAVRGGGVVEMPPKSRLPAAEVAALSRWVENGLPWTPAAAAVPSTAASTAAGGFDLQARRAGHWAWQPVRPAAVPAVRDPAWCRDPVDRFVLARLDAADLKPAADAGRRSLIRRLAFDLTGLPPTPDDVRAFAADDRPDADARLVDRLLAAPGFGVRWGRHWLDLVRYAETRGHEFDNVIPNAWHYRDYVVRALNADVPYAEFVTEQVAGDLLDRPRLDPATGANESLLATGFWFLGEGVHSPVDTRQDEADRLDNSVDVLGKTFLGLTVACARCHDHKFDAISQRDYYALTGFLVSSGYRQGRFAADDRDRRTAESLQALRDQARAQVLALAARLARPGLDRLQDDLLEARASRDESATHDRPGRWREVLRAAEKDRLDPLHAFALAANPSSATVATAPAPTAASPAAVRVVCDYAAVDSLSGLRDGYSFGLRPVSPGDLGPGGGLVLRGGARRDPAFRHLKAGPTEQRDLGRLGTWDRAGQTLKTPEFYLESGHLWYLARGAGRAYAAVNSHLLVAGPLHGALLTEWTDGGKGWRWVRHDLVAYRGLRTRVEVSPVGAGDLDVARVVETLTDQPPPDPSEIEPLSGGTGGPVALAAAVQRGLIETTGRMADDRVAAGPDAEIVARRADWLIHHLDLLADDPVAASAAVAAEFRDLRENEATLAGRVPAGSPTAPTISDGPGSDAPLLIRGSTKSPAADVPRRFLEALGGGAPEGPGSGRRALARELTDPTNPFANRVIVNRVWHHLFGRGLVATVDNFGVLGEAPTHPELLDHLADRFARDGGSLKRLIRSLVLSRTYQMSSSPDPAAERLDPEVKLLHRARVRRLEAEPIRDAILAISGRLDDRLDGPSVPVHLTAYMDGRGKPSASGPLDGDGRRSVYLAVRRNFLTPMLLAFDAPIPFSTVGRRNVSNVPAQALTLMNDPLVAGQAALWADRVLRPAGTAPADRLAAMYLAAFAREPGPEESALALEFLEDQGAELGLPAGAWRTDRRVWAGLAHVLWNSKEFVFLD